MLSSKDCHYDVVLVTLYRQNITAINRKLLDRICVMDVICKKLLKYEWTSVAWIAHLLVSVIDIVN